MLAHSESSKGDEDNNNSGVDSYWSRNVGFLKVPTKTTDIRKIKGWRKKSFAVTDEDKNSLTVVECQQELENRKLKCIESIDSLPLVSCVTTTIRDKSDLKQQIDLESEGKSHNSTCSDVVNTDDQEVSSLFKNEIITEFKKEFSDSLGSNSEHSVCKKVKFEFPANDEVFSDNFIRGDLKKGKRSVSVTSQSAFVSEELQHFLNFNSTLNVDYEIPQLEAAGCISHDKMSAVFPVGMHHDNMKFKQSNTQVQRTEGYHGTIGPKAKTLAEKRRLLEQEMKSKKVSQGIKSTVGTRTKIKQKMSVNLSCDEQPVIQYIEGKNGEKINSINYCTIERRSRRLLPWNKEDVCGEDNENRLPDLNGTICIKEETFSDKSLKKKKRKKTNRKLKKLETHMKLFEKSDSLPKRLNHDFQLNECNIEEEMANLTGSTPKVGMILNIGVGRHLYDEAVHNLELVQGDNDIIRESTAKFAACAVVDCSAKVTVKRILVPVVCNKLISLMYQASEEKRKECFSQSIQNKQQHEHIEDDYMNTVNLDDDDLNIVDEGVVGTVVKLIDYVEARETHKNFDKNICYDPDVPKPVVTKKTVADYASKYKKPMNKRVGDKVASQLNKLGVTLIDFDGESVSTKDYKQKVCCKEYCKLGCVCDSLQVPPRHVTHCGNSYCMFTDKCSCSLYDKLKEKLSPSILRIQKETEKKMAKEERKYHQTIIMSKDKMVYSESDKRKREIKLPVKYRDDLIILSEDEELLVDEHELSKPKKRLTDKTLKSKKQSPVKLNNQPIHCSEQSEMKVNMKPCYIRLEKIDTNGIESRCLFHYVRNCQCLKNSGDNKLDIYIKKCDKVCRNVAKKKTSGVVTNRIKKCNCGEDGCVCSVNSNLAGFGVIKEVMSLEPEEFYGNMSDAGASDMTSKSKDSTDSERNSSVSDMASKSKHSTNSERNSRCKRLCNNCKRHSNKRFMCDILKSATAPLPVIHTPCRWWVIELEHDDSMYIGNKFIQITVPYRTLLEIVKKASNRSCTVSLLLKGKKNNKYVHYERYGAYAVPGLTKIVFFGPYDIKEKHNLCVYRLIAERKVGVPFLSANKSHLLPENKNDKTERRNVMSVCDMCKQHFDYGVNSCWWYSEACRDLFGKNSSQVTNSSYAANHEQAVKQTKSNGDVVFVMDTLDIEEHGVDVIKREGSIDEVDDFINFEKKELQNLMDEHILDNEISRKPNGKEIQNVINKQLSEGKKKIDEAYVPINLNDSNSVNNIIPQNVKIGNNNNNNNNNDGDGNYDEAVNKEKGIRKNKIIMNNVFKKLENGDDKFVRIIVNGESNNIIGKSGKGVKIRCSPLENKIHQNRVASKTELIQNRIITTTKINKVLSHSISQKEKERRKSVELSRNTTVNDCQCLLDVTQVEVNNTVPHFTSSILVDSSSGNVTGNSLSDYAQEELEVMDGYLDAEYLRDEDDHTDLDNSDEEVACDTSDPHLILHKPKRKLQLLNFGAKITKSVLCMERSPSECEELPKAVLFCEVPGIDAIPVIECDEHKLVIADPLKQTVRHQFQHSVYASQWLQKLFRRHMIFSDEVKLSWSLIKNKHLIAKMRLFSPGILTNLKLILTPTGIEELIVDDTDSLKKQRYKIKFEYNKKRLEHLVLQKQELSSTNLCNLLTKATSKVKQLTKESIEIAWNLSQLGRRNRQLKNRLHSLLAGLDSETQLKAKKLIKDVKYQELLKHFYCKESVSSGHTVKILEEIDLEAIDNDDDDSDLEVVSTYIPEFEDTDRTVSTNLKRTRGTEKQTRKNSHVKKQKISSLSGRIRSSSNCKETETSDIVIDLDEEDYTCSSEKDKDNCSLAGSFNEVKKSISNSTHEGILDDYISTAASKSFGNSNDIARAPQQLNGHQYAPAIYEPFDNDITVLSQQSSSHGLSDVASVKCSDSTVKTNSVALGQRNIITNNYGVKVLRTPRLAISSIPSQKSAYGISQNNISFLKPIIPLKGNEKGETNAVKVTESSNREISNQYCQRVIHAAEADPSKNVDCDSNDVYVLSDSLYNGERMLILENQNKNKAFRNIVVPQIQPKRLHVLSDKNEKSILGKVRPKRWLFDRGNMSPYVKMSLKSCVPNIETEGIYTKVNGQKIIPTLMCVPNGPPVVLRSNSVRRVKVIKPESIIKPKFPIKRRINGISLEGSDGGLTDISQQFSLCSSNKTDEYINQETSSAPSIVTHDVQNVGQHISPISNNSNNTNKAINVNNCVPNGILVNTSQQGSVGSSNKTDEHISQQISSDLSATQNLQSVVHQISPILYKLSNSGNKQFVVKVAKQANIISNNPKNTGNFADPTVNGSLSVPGFQKLSNTGNANIVPKYTVSARARPMFPAPPIQNAYVLGSYSPNQRVRLVTAPNYSGRSILVSHHPNRSNIGHSSYQSLQSTGQQVSGTTGRSIRYNTEEHLIRPHVPGNQSVRPNVIVNHFNTGRSICTINPSATQTGNLHSSNIAPSANSVHFNSRVYSGPLGRQ